MKKCNECGESKLLSEFHRHPKTRDGRLGRCAACVCEYTRVFRRDHDHVRARDAVRAKMKYRRGLLRVRSAASRIEEPEKHRAHAAVRAAIRRGDLKRKPCEVCGKTDRIHAHHEDYSKPLDIAWLCSRHHSLHHVASSAA